MINAFALSGAAIAVSSGVMALLMFFLGKERVHYLWGLVCISVLVWGVGVWGGGSVLNPERSLFWWRFGHYGVIFIPITYTHFIYSFLNKKSVFIPVLYLIGLVLSIFNLLTDHVVSSVRWFNNEFYYNSYPGILYPFLTALFFLLVIYGTALLFSERQRTADVSRKRQISYFLAAMLIGYVGGGMAFLPVFNIDIYPWGNYAIVPYPFIVGYAVLKYKLFNIKLFYVQGLTILVWLLLLIRTLFSQNLDDLFSNVILLSGVVVIGFVLIRGFSKDIENTRAIENITNDLTKVNSVLRQNNQLKTEFVSIATHQLRSPLTAIKGYSSMVLEGSFGQVSEKLTVPLERIYQSTESLIQIVQDFLDVSRIDQGKMKYEMDEINLSDLVQESIDELRPNIQKSNLEFRFYSGRITNDTISADKNKLKQVILNLIDNALKYTRRGFVHVEVYTDEPTHTVHLTVSDSGMGIKPEVMPKLFERFSRADNADEVNVAGTGLGLYIAKQIIEAHHGRIWAESEGDGKGSTFHVSVPLVSSSDKKPSNTTLP